MGFLTDDYIALTDANPKPEANGRPLYFRIDGILTFYQREGDASTTNVITNDGRAYIVKESAEDIYKKVR